MASKGWSNETIKSMKELDEDDVNVDFFAPVQEDRNAQSVVTVSSKVSGNIREAVDYFAAVEETRKEQPVAEVEGITKTVTSAEDVIRDFRDTSKTLQSVQGLTEKETDRIEHLLRCLQYEVSNTNCRKRRASKNSLGFSRSRNEKKVKNTIIM